MKQKPDQKNGFSSPQLMNYVNLVKTDFRHNVTEMWLYPLEERLKIFH